MRRARLLVALAVMAAARGASAAEADHSVLEALRVEPGECYDGLALTPHVARWLRRPTVDRRIQVEIRGQPRAQLELVVRRDGRLVGGRTFPRFDAPCEKVRAAVGLAAALAIDATALESLGVPPPRPAEPAAPPPRAGPGVSASLEGAAIFGVLPAPSPGFAPGLDLAFLPAFTLRFSGLFTGASALAVGPSAAADVTLFAGRLDACATLPARVVTGRACAGLFAGALRASGSGSPRTFSPSAPWAAAAARLDARIRIADWFQLAVGADAIVPFTRPNLEVVGQGGMVTAQRKLPTVGAAIDLGPVVVFR